MNKSSIVILILISLVLGCQQYHDTTAKYNAYFLANQKLEVTEDELFSKPNDNYNDILNIITPIDTTQAKSKKAAFDYIIEKASHPIQWHKSSKWVDDCYLLIGKARMYTGDFQNAILSFKYVFSNSEDPDAKHTALIWLMRTFMELKEFSNFQLIKEAINREKQPFNKINIQDYHLVNAQYFKYITDYYSASKHLEKALLVTDKRRLKSRYHFIMGQLLEEQEEYEKAYSHFSDAIKYQTTYETAFQAGLLSKRSGIQSNQLEKEKTEKYFNSLLKEDTNWDERDRIHYEIALAKLHYQNLEKAIFHLNESVQLSSTNPTQKAYSYLLLGKLNYDSIKNFQNAAALYDSAIQILPKDVRGYNKIASRGAILNEFADTYYHVKHLEKLLDYSSLSEEELGEILDKEIEKEKQEILKQKENEKLNEKRKQRIAPISTTLPKSAKTKGAQWYFYNPQAVATGRTNFIKKWGNRPLEDNWRRSNKQLSARTNTTRTNRNNFANNQNLNNSQSNNNGESNKDESSEIENIFASVKSKEERINEVPKTPEGIEKVKKELADGLYKLGKIYWYKLLESKHAIETLERFSTDFPKHEETPEAIYTLHSIADSLDQSQKGKYYSWLQEKYPETFYAKILKDPQILINERAVEDAVTSRYNAAYRQFEERKFKIAFEQLDSINKDFPDNAMADKVELLKILSFQKWQKKFRYVELEPEETIQFDLANGVDNFIISYSQSELLPIVESIKESTNISPEN